MRNQTDTLASQKALVVLGVPTGPLATTLSSHSGSASVPVSPVRGDSAPAKSQEELIGSRPKVSRASRLHFFQEQDLRSILDFVI